MICRAVGHGHLCPGQLGKALLRLGHSPSPTDDSACYTEGLSSDFQVLDRYTKHCKQPWTRSLSWPPRQRCLASWMLAPSWRKSDSEVQTMYERFHCNLKMDHGIFFMSDNQIKLTISKFRKTKFKEYQFSFRAGIPAISRRR